MILLVSKAAQFYAE